MQYTFRIDYLGEFHYCIEHDVHRAYGFNWGTNAGIFFKFGNSIVEWEKDEYNTFRCTED